MRNTDWKNSKNLFVAPGFTESIQRHRDRTASTHRKVEKSILFSTFFLQFLPSTGSMLLVDVGYLFGVGLGSVLRALFGPPLLDGFAVWFLVFVFMW
ncbi:hypothetical protein [Paeniglutamicibacter kerguelensis]|uniref:Uncharacterized protein n=1 Tax=Paeniglutamicibacter kerguelensis TaxID=254788 RepID=A0ABS4X8R2_9MICC|nr:hypothetical protein [Paeniglutamicibacter kerguelensis]MBP2384768.1 hypothetical protein [Paeniglutamicibacter kerguelensis]